MVPKKTAGRKPIGDKALTEAEKKRRQRAKQLCQIKAAENNGYKMLPVLLSNKQLTSLSKFSFLETKDENLIDSRKINDVIFHAMKMYLKGLKQDYIERGHPADLVEACAYPDNYIDDYNKLGEIEAKAQELFKQWEKNQL
jgi:hypothetical protein